jgi:Plasmid pRiA4b ORF-3-like protein
MESNSQPEAYCVHVWIRGIHPMLWRRFLVRSDSTLADLHVVLQIGFDWTDFHLHRFRIRKKDYAVPRLGGLACHDARKIKLADLDFRINTTWVTCTPRRVGASLRTTIRPASGSERPPMRATQRPGERSSACPQNEGAFQFSPNAITLDTG